MRYLANNSAYIPVLEGLVRQGQGTGFVLLMEHSGKLNGYKDYSIHLRFDQPCQGGDMRKYESAHPGRCTQPHNERPSDLSCPFPDGKPSAIGFYNLKYWPSEAVNEFFQAVVVSASSPWVKGFGGPSNIHIIKDGDLVVGFILKRLNVDPTVLVNGVNFLNTFNAGGAKVFLELKAAGLDDNEALMSIMLNGYGASWSTLSPTWDYRFPVRFSARSFFGQKPVDLSGGLYEDGADYNRTYVQDVFCTPKGLSWMTEMKKILGKTWGYTIEQYVAAVKEFIKRSMDAETDEDVGLPYQYRLANGKVEEFPDYALEVNPSLKRKEKKQEKAA